MSNIIETAEKLYKHVNPNTKMDTPNSVYITVEKWAKKWSESKSELTLFDWCIANKTKPKQR